MLGPNQAYPHLDSKTVRPARMDGTSIFKDLLRKRRLPHCGPFPQLTTLICLMLRQPNVEKQFLHTAPQSCTVSVHSGRNTLLLLFSLPHYSRAPTAKTQLVITEIWRHSTLGSCQADKQTKGTHSHLSASKPQTDSPFSCRLPGPVVVWVTCRWTFPVTLDYGFCFYVILHRR